MTRDDRWIHADELDPDSARRVRDDWARGRPISYVRQAHPPRRIDWYRVVAWACVIAADAAIVLALTAIALTIVSKLFNVSW